MDSSMKICGGTNTVHVCGVELPKQGSYPIRKCDVYRCREAPSNKEALLQACPFGHPGTDAFKTPKPSDVDKPSDIDLKPSDVNPKAQRH